MTDAATPPRVQAFIDDSASEKGDRRLFMAGFLATAETWTLFCEAWAAELQAGRPIAYLKMREANGREREFAGWSQVEVALKLGQLKRVIDHFQPLSFHTSTRRDGDWEAFKAIAPRGLGQPHFSCTFAVVAGLSRFAAGQNFPHPIEFIFDTQTEIEDDIDLFFEHMVQSLPREAQALIAGKLLYEDDKLAPPLQAADMLAWHLRRRHEDRGSWMDGPEDLAPINPRAHLDCGDLDLTLPSTHEGVAKLVAGIAGLQSKAEWRGFKKLSRALLAEGYVPPLSSSRDGHFRALRKWLGARFRGG